MTAEPIDSADELDRFAHEAKEGRSGTMRDTPESLTLKAAAKELRTLRANAEKLLDAWIWKNDDDWPFADRFVALIPVRHTWEPNVQVRPERFPTQEAARAAVRKACGIEEQV